MSLHWLRRALLGALLLATLSPALAAAVAARIDGVALFGVTVDTMWRMQRLADPKAQRAQVRDTLVENRLLAAAARQRFGTNALTAGRRVAFTRDVTFDDQLAGMLRTLHGGAMERELARTSGGIDGLVFMQPLPSDGALDAVFGKPGGLRLDSTLNAAQLERARSLVLLRYALPRGGRKGAVTAFDVYQRQNVQGRVSMLARDVDFMRQQARLLVAQLYVMEWGRRRFGKPAMADLRRAVSEQADVRALMRMHGMDDDAHGDSRLLDQLARAVTPAQVRDYYQRHRDQFTRIERVRARHIRLPDEDAANRVAALLAQGADFAATARRHSSAPDAASGGDIGWIRHSASPDWMAQLLFSQAQGEVSPPIRTAAGPGEHAAWEIVLVEQREQGFQPVESESVRYMASRALAREAALAQFDALRAGVRRAARVELAALGGATP